MTYARTALLSLALAGFAASTTSAAPARKGPARPDPIRSAMAAAPTAVAAHATIVRANPDGSMTTLRKGTNGFTCMPDNPETPGPDPMCMDANAMDWAMAWIGHKPPPEGRPGLMYMLAGGTDASNTDPHAKRPDGAWISTGPHVMIVGSHALLTGYPATPRPDTRAPYVMWAGTPYAHLMVPVR